MSQWRSEWWRCDDEGLLFPRGCWLAVPSCFEQLRPLCRGNGIRSDARRGGRGSFTHMFYTQLLPLPPLLFVSRLHQITPGLSCKTNTGPLWKHPKHCVAFVGLTSPHLSSPRCTLCLKALRSCPQRRTRRNYGGCARWGFATSRRERSPPWWASPPIWVSQAAEKSRHNIL